MIQKPPKFSAGTVDLDDEDAHPATAAMEEHEAEPADEYVADTADDDLDVDLDAEMAARQRRGKLIFYGATAFGVILIGFVGYHQFAPLFQHQAAPAPVTIKAPSAAQPAPQTTANNGFLPVPPAGANLPGAATLPVGMRAGGAALPAGMTAGATGSASGQTGDTVKLPGPSGQDTGHLPGQDVATAGLPPSMGAPSVTAGPQGSGTTAAPAIMPSSLPAGIAAGPALPTPSPAMPMTGTDKPAVPQPAAIPATGSLPAMQTGASPSQPAGTPQLPVMPTLPAPVAAGQGATPAGALNGQAMAVPSSGSSLAKPIAPVMGGMTGSDPRIDDLAGKVAGLQASQKTTATQLQQIQASLDALQKQLASGGVAPAPKHAAEKSAASPAASLPRHRVHHEDADRQTPTSEGAANHTVSKWVLRSATPNGALLGHSGTGELQRVAVGDMVNGLGRITYIGEKNGRWVVQGVEGRVEE